MNVHCTVCPKSGVHFKSNARVTDTSECSISEQGSPGVHCASVLILHMYKVAFDLNKRLATCNLA